MQRTGGFSLNILAKGKTQRHHLMAVLLIGLTLAVFWPVCTYEFVLWDDQVNVYENPHFNRITASNVLQFWQRPYENLYIPLTYSVWAGIGLFARRPSAEPPDPKFDPRFFHVSNLLLHILSVLVVFAILRMMVKNDWAACGGALLFGLHPIQVEPVAWVTGMKDVLCGVLSVVAVWQYLGYRKDSVEGHDRRALKKCIYGTVAFVLALLAKPSAVIVPILAWVLAASGSNRRHSAAVIPHMDFALVIWMAVSVPFLAITGFSQATAVDYVTPLWARPLVVGDALAFYLHKLFFPVYLGLDYGRSPEFVLQHKWILLTGLIPCTLAVLAWRMRHSKPWLTAALGVFFLGVLPASGLVPFAFQKHSTVADRYLYLSMLGPAIAVAYLISYWIKRDRKTVAITFCVLVLGALGLRSAFQIQHWSSNEELFNHALKINPHSSAAHNNLGLTLDKKGSTQGAIDHYREAIRIRPKNAEAHNNLGNALTALGNTETALAQYREAVKIKPDYAKAHSNLGIALSHQGQTGNAFAQFEKALKLQPGLVGAHYNMALLLSKLARTKDAIIHYRAALSVDPDHADAHYNLANIFSQQGRIKQAIFHYYESLRINPAEEDAHNNLGIAFSRQGQLEEAMLHFRKTIAINPNHADAKKNLKIVLDTLQSKRP